MSRRAVFGALGLLLVAQNALLALGGPSPVLICILGLACVVGVPAFLVYHSGSGVASGRTERLAGSVILVLLLLMGAGLLANTVLPWVGVPGALGSAPVIGTVDILCAGLAALTYRRHPARYRLALPTGSGRDRTLIALSGTCVFLAVTGAIRLNNGAGGGVTFVMLLLMLVTFALTVAWRDDLSPATLPTVLYCLSLALLLMTSMRGWYTTGHDIQREYRVFELVKTHDNWKMARFQDPYNACLSITILPTIFWQWTRLSDPYVYKIFFQLLFALCPVLVYRLGTRFASRTVALLGTIYFVSFVTFFQDMPMLNRQEIAFLFLAAALLAAFNTGASLAQRRLWFSVFASGMVLSHYSTTYFTLATLVIAWFLQAGVGAARRARSGTRPKAAANVGETAAGESAPRWWGSPVFSLRTIGAVMLVAFVWSTPVTHTETGLSQTVNAVVASLRGEASGPRSADTSYSILSLSHPTPAQKLASYSQTIVRETARQRAEGIYYSRSLLARYPTPPAPDAKVPLTAAGRVLKRAGMDAGALNYAARQAAARLLQIFIGVGLLGAILGRSPRFRTQPEFHYIAVATMVFVLLQVVLPVISVDYGLLRAFQQALLVLNVLLVTGTLAIFARLGERRRLCPATGLALLFFASSTGIFTQLLGNYEPQLHLNNSGTYYDIYYVHPEEIAGIGWLQRHTAPSAQQQIQAEIQTDRYTFTRLQTFTPAYTINDIFPLLIRRKAYVFLGYNNVRNSQATTAIDGDLVTYDYPMTFLNDTKDLIYDNAGARVYK